MSRNQARCNFNTHSIKNRSLNVALAIVLGTAASLAFAQSTKDSFADTFASMQSLSSNSSNWQQDKPRLSNVSGRPQATFSIRQMQALSSDSPIWQLDQGKVEFDHGPTFAQAHPHGLSFSQYQAYAANSGEFAVPSTAGMPSFAAVGTVNDGVRHISQSEK
jgi:hypothetical protein